MKTPPFCFQKCRPSPPLPTRLPHLQAHHKHDCTDGDGVVKTVQIWIIILYFLSRSSADGASRLASEQISKQAFSRFFKHLSFKALRGGGGWRLSAHLRSPLPLNDPPVTLSLSHKVWSLAVKCPWSVFFFLFSIKSYNNLHVQSCIFRKRWHFSRKIFTWKAAAAAAACFPPTPHQLV